MSTAIADPTTRIAFISKGPDQVLTRRPVRNIIDGETGEKRVLTEDEWRARQEEANEARIARGEGPVEIDDTPWKVEFRDGMYVVPENLSDAGREKLLAFLRGHRLFNTPRGFYEQGKAPNEPRPTVSEQLAEIADATALGDVDRVEQAVDREKETHNREPVLVAAEAALARLRKLEAEIGAGAGHDGDAGEPRPDQDPPQ